MSMCQLSFFVFNTCDMSFFIVYFLKSYLLYKIYKLSAFYLIAFLYFIFYFLVLMTSTPFVFSSFWLICIYFTMTIRIYCG